MKTYETVIILNDRKIQDEGKDFIEEFSSRISRANGKILRKTPLGKKQFARQIKKHKTGIYWDVVFDLDEQAARTLEQDHHLDERVLRMQVFVYDRPEDPTKPKKETISEKSTQPEASQTTL